MPAPAPGSESKPSIFRRYWWVAGLAVAVGVVLVLAPAASSDPDGLDRVAQDGDFAHEADGSSFDFLPDYGVPGIDHEYWSLISAGLIGVAVVFVATVLLGLLLRHSRKARAP